MNLEEILMADDVGEFLPAGTHSSIVLEDTLLAEAESLAAHMVDCE
jgi:hypothetical protein